MSRKGERDDMAPAIGVFGWMIANGLIWLIAIFAICLLTSCASGPVTISAELLGGPAAVATAWENARIGPLETTPGGFIKTNQNANLGVIINRDEEEKDVWFFVEKNGGWRPYRGPCKVLTPKGWEYYNNLEAIHFESAFIQRVTLRLNNGQTAQEIKFSTYGRENDGDYYRRVNALLIVLPPENFKMVVLPHKGKWIFKTVSGYPYVHYLYLRYHDNPLEEIFGNQWIGWKIIL